MIGWSSLVPKQDGRSSFSADGKEDHPDTSNQQKILQLLPIISRHAHAVLVAALQLPIWWHAPHCRQMPVTRSSPTCIIH